MLLSSICSFLISKINLNLTDDRCCFHVVFLLTHSHINFNWFMLMSMEYFFTLLFLCSETTVHTIDQSNTIITNKCIGLHHNQRLTMDSWAASVLDWIPSLPIYLVKIDREQWFIAAVFIQIQNPQTNLTKKINFIFKWH